LSRWNPLETGGNGWSPSHGFPTLGAEASEVGAILARMADKEAITDALLDAAKTCGERAAEAAGANASVTDQGRVSGLASAAA
jgi:hypothetical protein